MQDGSRWLSGLQLRSLNREVLGSNPTDAVSNLGKFVYPMLPKSLGMLLVSEKDGSRSQPKSLLVLVILCLPVSALCCRDISQ